MKTLALKIRSLLTFGALLCSGSAALVAGGSVDPAFLTPDIGFGITRVAVQSDGKVLIAGGMRFDASSEPLGLQRLNSDGSVDSSFNIGTGFIGQALVIPGVFTNIGAAQLNALVPTPAGILVGGNFEKLNGQPRTNIVRVLASGAVDPAFAPRVDGILYSIVPLAGGKILIAGTFQKVNGTSRAGMARLNADGSLDTAFTPAWGTLSPGVRAIAVQADGKYLLGGGFLSFSGALSQKLAVRMGTDGTLDATFTPPTSASLGETILDLTIQADGKIVIVGGFSSINGTARKSVGRLNANGSLDTGWPGPGLGNGGGQSMNAIAPAAGGQLYLGGAFDTFNGLGPGGIIRLNADGSRDTTFQKPAGSTTFSVATLAVQSDGKVVIGGQFALGTTVSSVKVLLRLLDRDAGPPPAPAITRQPAGFSAAVGRTGTGLSVEATGAPPITYQWQHDGATLPFKTDPSLAFGPLQTGDSGDYRVIVGNAGGSVTSSVAAVTVILPARVTVQPQDQTVNTGDRVTFTVGTSGTPPISYQRRRNLENIPNETNSTLTLQAARLTDIAGYSVAVSNAAGGEPSREARLTVRLAPPSISIPPASHVVVLPDTNLTAAALVGRRLCLTVAGALPPWIVRGGYCIDFSPAGYTSPAGGALAGASAGTFAVRRGTAPPATLVDFARFFPDGQTATLTLLANGIFEFNRDNLVADQNGTWLLNPPFVPPPGPTVEFSVTATGASLQYQWRRNGNELIGATNATLSISNVTAANLGDYTVVVTNAGGFAVSDPVHLTAVEPVVGIARSVGGPALSWSAGPKLQFTSTLVPVSWSDVPGAISPFTPAADGGFGYYRVVPF